MGLKQTKNRPYKSKYGGGFVSSASYIVELVCEKIAVKNRKKLNDKFWKDAYWGAIFKKQLVLANNLLKLYEPLPIINALKNPDSRQIISLGMATQLDPLIERERSRLDLQKGKTSLEAIKTDEKPIPPVSKNNIFSKLKGL